MNERQAHADLADRRTYSPRIHFDPLAEAGLGVDAQDSKLASDFAELEGEKARRTDRLVNWLAVALVMLIAAFMLSWCSGMTQPEDIAPAQELCAKRGGFTHVSRYEMGKNIIINCADGTFLDVRLNAK